MSSTPLSSAKKSPFVQNQGHSVMTNATGISIPGHSVNPLSTVNTTRIRGPKPFYRSRVTPDPFDYSNEKRRETDYSQRRYSVNQINGSSLSNSYESDQELSGLTMTRPSSYTPQPYRSTTPTHRPMISVNASQSPLITIASHGLPNRSEIRFSSSPNPAISNLRGLAIARPDSPSLSINRSMNYPSNGHEKSFHISVGAPANNPRDLSSPSIHMFGRTSPSLHSMEMPRDPMENRLISPNLAANRFKPLMAYASLNRNQSPVMDASVERRSPAIINLPPTSSAFRHNNLNRTDSNHLDHLRNLSIKNLQRSSALNLFGVCAKCHDEILGEENGLVTMDRMYHVACFTCTMCGGRLRGMHFYSMENQPYCESCYINSLEKCVVCARPISDRILRATGKAYHAQCFCCVVCRKSLDGVPFTIDIHTDVHCIDCFHQKFAPRCSSCHRAILPPIGQEETIRIVAFDRNYHIDCYRCENCQIQLNDEHGCCPIDEHIFCPQCYHFYVKTRLNHH